MLLPAILGFLCGMVLGFRFKVLILVPTIASGWALAAMFGMLTGASWTLIGMTMVTIAIALQAGYGAGIGVRRLMVAARMSRRRGWAQKRAAAPGAY
jgi:hypothetical protein